MRKPVLRCYAYRMNGFVYARCVELNLLVRATSFKAVRKSLDEAIVGYIETVFDTDQPLTIAQLLNRGSWKHRFVFEGIRTLSHIHQLRHNIRAFFQPEPRLLCHAQGH